MNKTAQSVWENCLSFIKDNIKIKPTKLGLNQSNQLNLPIMHYIQVPSKFFLRMAREHYVKLLKLP
jgi:chromosomal replication initiator protein